MTQHGRLFNLATLDFANQKLVAPKGAGHSLRITQARRATAYRQGDFMRFLTIQQDHDSTYGKK